MSLAKKAEDSDEVRRLLNAKFYPVITIVLYYSIRHWVKSRTLFECLDIPESIKPFVNDSKLNVIEIAWLSDEEAAKFTSDFRIVVDYFRQKRINKDYKPSKWVVDHVDSLLKLMRVLTGDQSFENEQNKIVYDYEKGERFTMDNFFSRKIAEGKAEGRAEGKAEGKAEGRAEGIAEGEAKGEAKGMTEGLMKASKAIYQKLLEMGFNPEVASQATSITLRN
ncbi:MAG: hypothetical protein IJT58_02955 [Synergistaceae bacterium]|nr:hypothetical protein [Synergistaceae bacterium]